MVKTIKAKYSNGLIEPLEPLEVEEGKEILITLSYPLPQDSTEDPTMATFGGWKDLLDCEQFEKDVYESRLLNRRPAVDL
jgi:predicted DNA-binding antitoxin AbrB/MazE fold protein